LHRGQHFWRQRADGISARLHIEHQVEPQNDEQEAGTSRGEGVHGEAPREFLFGQKITIRACVPSRKWHLNHFVSFNLSNSPLGTYRPIGWLRRGLK
jgi:hypothetical protein